jgi:hypothetical protein
MEYTTATAAHSKTENAIGCQSLIENVTNSTPYGKNATSPSLAGV